MEINRKNGIKKFLENNCTILALRTGNESETENMNETERESIINCVSRVFE